MADIFVESVFILTIFILLCPSNAVLVAPVTSSVATSSPFTTTQTATTPAVVQPQCPTFPVTRHNQTLVFKLLPSKCQMTVRIRLVRRANRDIKQQPYYKGRKLSPLSRNIRLPDVSIEPIPTVANTEGTVSDTVTITENLNNNNATMTNESATPTDLQPNVTGTINPNVIQGSTTTTEEPVTCPNLDMKNIGLMTVIDTVRKTCQLVVGVKREIISTTGPFRRNRYRFSLVFQYLDDVII